MLMVLCFLAVYSVVTGIAGFLLNGFGFAEKDNDAMIFVAEYFRRIFNSACAKANNLFLLRNF